MSLVSDAYVMSLRSQSRDRGHAHGSEGSVSNSDAAAIFSDSLMESQDDRKEAVSVADIVLRGVNRPGIIIVCAEPGMGKTSLLYNAVSRAATTDRATRYVDLAGLTLEVGYRRLRELGRWCAKSNVHARFPLVAFDNMEIGDESDVERRSGALRRMAASGCTIVLSMLPEAEPLVEQLGECVCYWSCDLRTACPSDREQAEQYDRYTHGIPALVSALGRVDVARCPSIAADPSYQEPFVRLVDASFRATLMSEERRLRAAMLLLSSGTRQELEGVLGEIDDELWRSLARDAPLFGVNVARDTFDCAGAHGVDGINAIYQTLSHVVALWPSTVARAASVLASRGDYGQSAVISLLCSHDRDRILLGLEWASQYINAGELNVVGDALLDAREEGLTTKEGAAEARCILGALGVRGFASRLAYPKDLAGLDMSTRIGSYAAGVIRCRALMQGKGLDDHPRCEDLTDEISEGLSTHGSVVALLAKGDAEGAFRLLLESPSRLETGTILRSLVAIDFMLCSLLVGILPGKHAVMSYVAAGEFLERADLPLLVGIHEIVYPICQLLVGRHGGSDLFDVRVHRANRHGDELLRGCLLLVSSISDLRLGAMTRAHVRLEMARRSFEGIGTQALAKSAHVIDLAVRTQLGERVEKAEIQSCKGVSTEHDRVVAVFMAALAAFNGKRRTEVPLWGGKGCPGNVLWLVNVLCGDCGAFSVHFRKVMPDTWRDSVTKATSEVDAFFENSRMRWEDQERHMVVLSETDDKTACLANSSARVEVYALGGFEVRVNGLAVGTSALERRRAKSVLAVLVAMPEHAAKRYSLIDAIWPTYDYDSANKSLYSATSVLRRTMSGPFEDGGELQLVISNKTEGTIALNGTYFKCDVDLFESKARALVDAKDDRDAVALCRDVEDVYRGDLFVPPHDGTGIVTARSKELRNLFADAMIAGATAALNLRMESLACRFARKAAETDREREDAIRALVAALCAAGRQVEAERAYEEYVSHVVDVARRPPSKGLREAVESLLQKFWTGTALGRKDAPHSFADIEIVKDALPSEPEQMSMDLSDVDASRQEVAKDKMVMAGP